MQTLEPSPPVKSKYFFPICVCLNKLSFLFCFGQRIFKAKTNLGILETKIGQENKHLVHQQFVLNKFGITF